jgi:dihydroxy-acid dehydratase
VAALAIAILIPLVMEKVKFMDWILVVIGLSLIATLTAFLLGLIPYPIGWIVLLLLFALRVMQIKNKTKIN